MRSIYTFILLTMFAVACKTAKPSAGGNANATNTNLASGGNNESYILAVVIKASRKALDSPFHFEVTSIKKKPGRLKDGQNDNSGEDFTVSFADENNKIINTYYIKNPLDGWIESANGEGRLETTTIRKNEAYIPMRTNYKPNMKKLIIERISLSEKFIIPLSTN